MIKKILFITLFLLIGLILKTLYQAGSFKTITSHSELNNISIYNGVAGTEDLALDETTDRLYISSYDRWNSKDTGDHKDGIYLLELNSAVRNNTQPTKLKMDFKEEFHPHGISFFEKNNKKFLFVINHNKKASSIEVFQILDRYLVHLKSYKNEQLCCPNDLVAVDVDKFYVTNDHGTSKVFGRTLEDYLKIANANVLYFDGENYSKVIDDLSYANGIEVSRDGKTLYVTETTGRSIHALHRNIKSGQLTPKFIKNLSTGLDNITIDSDDNLWIGAHPKLLDFVSHSKSRENISPSQVLKLTPNKSNGFDVTEIYLNSGEQLSGSSVALHYKGELFVGVVFDNKLLRGGLN